MFVFPVGERNKQIIIRTLILQIVIDDKAGKSNSPTTIKRLDGRRAPSLYFYLALR
jgi:hypothetical protein